MVHLKPLILNGLLLLSFSFFLSSCSSGNSPAPDPSENGRDSSLVEGEGALNSNTIPQFLSLSDVHIDEGNCNVYFGSRSRNIPPFDTGDSLWLRAKSKLEKVIAAETPKFMVYLGDLPAHDGSKRSQNVKAMLKGLRSIQMSNPVPIFYLPGNNDGLGGDYSSFLDSVRYGKDGTPFYEDPSSTDPWPVLYETSKVSPVISMDYNPKYGFYAAQIKIDTDTLNIVALNTVIFSNSSSYPYNPLDGDRSQQESASKQMDWFTKKMDAYQASDKILLMMHIPPGKDGFGRSPMWKPSLTYQGNKLINVFLQTVGKHKDQIKGILTSHTHLDGLRRLYYEDANGNTALAEVSISTPGITVNHGNNPGFKLVQFQPGTFEFTNFTTYFAQPSVVDDFITNACDLNGRYSFYKNQKMTGRFVFSNDSYTFSGTYVNSSNPGSNLFTTIAGYQDSNTLLNDMYQILQVKSVKSGPFQHPDALDVYPE